MSVSIHPTAIVSPKAKLGVDVVVGPYCVIADRVSIGDSCRLHSHVVVDGNTTIGAGTEIFPFASVGSRPQDLKYRGEDSVLLIGEKNMIREYVTLQPGTQGGGMKTVIGSGNLFMVSSHVGHDTVVGNGNILANSVALAGHVTIGDNITLGGLSAVHQFVKIGDLAFIGGGSMVVKDLPPYCMAQGDRAALVGLNKIGMERRGIPSEEIDTLRGIYREVFFGEGTFRERIAALIAREGEAPVRSKFLNFISSSERGVTFPRDKKSDSD